LEVNLLTISSQSPYIPHPAWTYIADSLSMTRQWGVVLMPQLENEPRTSDGSIESVRYQLMENAQRRGLSLDDMKIVFGGTSVRLAAFAPIVDLSKVSVDQLASGVTIGMLTISGTRSSLQGTYEVRQTIEPGAEEGVAELIGESGNVVSLTPLRLLPSNLPTPVEDVTVTVGDVTILAGPSQVCILWDDPPGTPGGMCHRQCYGW
jgi:hypothetical protein